MERRGDDLNIFTVSSDKCRIFRYSAWSILMFLVPTLAEIRLRLSETEVEQGNLSGSVSAVTEGLAIEKSQYVKRHFTHAANWVTGIL